MTKPLAAKPQDRVFVYSCICLFRVFEHLRKPHKRINDSTHKRKNYKMVNPLIMKKIVQKTRFYETLIN